MKKQKTNGGKKTEMKKVVEDTSTVLDNNNDSGFKYGIFSVLLTAVTTMLLFSAGQRMFASKYVIMSGDFFQQSVPMIRMFYARLADFFASGNINDLFYSDNFSLGSDVSAQYAYFSCFSPFNIVYLLTKNDNLASIIIIILKLSTSSFFFWLFSRNVLKRNGLFTSVLSMLYTLGGYTVLFYFNIHFLEGVILLPLILTLLYEFIHTGKVWKLSLAYAYLFIVSFYSAYLVGIFSFLIFVLYLSLYYREKELKVSKLVLKYMLGVLTALLLSMFVIAPAVIYIASNMANDRTLFTGMDADIIDVYGNLFFGMNQGREGVYPYIYSGILAILIIPVFFMDKLIPKKTKIMVIVPLGILFLSCLITPLYLFWHAFDAPDSCGYRFSYLISFILVSMLVYEWPMLWEQVKTRTLVIICGCNILMYLIVWLLQDTSLIEENQGASILGLELNIVFMALYVGVIHFKDRFSISRAKNLISVLMIVELILNGAMVLVNNTYAPIEYKEIYETIDSESTEIFDEIAQKDQGFYRIYDKYIPSENYMLTKNQKGVGYLSSFENVNLRNTMRKLGYVTTPRVLTDYGSTNLMKMLLGQKYLVHTYGVVYEQDVDRAYYEVNQNALSLGYMVADSIYDVAILDSDNPFENQNKLIGAMTGIDEDYFVIEDADIDARTSNVSFDYSESPLLNAVVRYSNKDNSDSNVGRVDFSYEDHSEDYVRYAYLPQQGSYRYSNSPRFFSDGGDYGTIASAPYVSTPRIVQIGANAEGKDEFSIYLKSDMLNPVVSYDAIYVYKALENNLQLHYQALANNQLEILDYLATDIKGKTVATPENNVLFLSIPYDKFWKLYVDGERVEINPVLDGTFLAAKLQEGEHDIELKYENDYYRYGLYLSVLGIAFFAVLSMLENRKKNNK